MRRRRTAFKHSGSAPAGQAGAERNGSNLMQTPAKCGKPDNALIQRALNDIISARLKRNSSPSRAMTHEDKAIVTLLEACPEWKPWNEESRLIVDAAKTHTTATARLNLALQHET